MTLYSSSGELNRFNLCLFHIVNAHFVDYSSDST